MTTKAPYLKLRENIANPTLDVECSQCRTVFKTWTRRAQYCSAKCKTAAWRAANTESKEPGLCEWCKEPVPPPRRLFCSDAHKNRYFKAKTKREREPALCWWCSTPMVNQRAKQFCTKSHYEKFRWAKRTGQPITVKVSETLTVQTREYADIPAVRGKWLAHLSDYSV